MALTLGAPTLATTARNALLDGSSLETLLLTGSAQDAALVLLNGSTELVRWDLNSTAPLNGSSSGSATLNFQSSSATASAGTATVPDTYHIEDQAETVQISGSVTGSDGITSGQTVTVGTITITVPAS